MLLFTAEFVKIAEVLPLSFSACSALSAVNDYSDGNLFVIIPVSSNTNPMEMAESAQLKAGQ